MKQVRALTRNSARYAFTVLSSRAMPAVATPSVRPRLTAVAICARNVVAPLPATRRISVTLAVPEAIIADPSKVVTIRKLTKLCANST